MVDDTSVAERSTQVGMVFQFPERHFLGHTIRSELTFGWAQTLTAYQTNIQRVQSALRSVGLTSFDLETPTSNLSDGFKRRLALAVQLVRQPTVLLLDEPLAGLDWKVRRAHQDTSHYRFCFLDTCRYGSHFGRPEKEMHNLGGVPRLA